MAKKSGLGLSERIQSATSRPRVHMCFLDRMEADVAAELVEEVKKWMESPNISRSDFIRVIREAGRDHGDEQLAGFSDGKLVTIEGRIRAGVL